MVEEMELIIRPIDRDDLPAVLEVYRQCEDFLALGPISEASMAMGYQVISGAESQQDGTITFRLLKKIRDG